MDKISRIDYTIQYQDLDQNNRLRLYTLENYLLNSAGIVADQGGFGMRYLVQQNLTWVLTNLSLQISYLPTVDEVLTVETWVEKNIHMLSVRNFRLSVAGRLIGLVRSVWAVISMTDRTAQNVFDQPAFLDMANGLPVSLERAPRMHAFSNVERVISGWLAGDYREIQPSESSPVGIWPHKVQYSDIDYNGHCNSCKYLEFMLNACEPTGLKRSLPLSPAELGETRGLRIDIKYAREVRRGDDVAVLFLNEGNAIHYELRTAAGEISCQACISACSSTAV